MTRLAQAYASPLADGIAQFIAHKRVLGRRYETEVYAPRLFDRYLVAQGITKLDAITPGASRPSSARSGSSGPSRRVPCSCTA